MELHIEQGRILEEDGKRIGIVTAISGPTRPRIEIMGLADHSGGTPKHMRRDALCAGAELILWLEESAKSCSGDGVVATVGTINVEPNALHTIPGRVILWPDIRSVRYEPRKHLVEELKAKTEAVEKARGVKIDYECTWDEPSVPSSAYIVNTIRQVCEELNVGYHLMPSWGDMTSNILAPLQILE